MQIRRLQTSGCTDQKGLALVTSKGGDGLGGFYVEVAVLVSLACLDQSVLRVVAFELHNGTCNFKRHTYVKLSFSQENVTLVISHMHTAPQQCLRFDKPCSCKTKDISNFTLQLLLHFHFSLDLSLLLSLWVNEKGCRMLNGLNIDNDDERRVFPLINFG